MNAVLGELSSHPLLSHKNNPAASTLAASGRPGFINFVLLTSGSEERRRSLSLPKLHNVTLTKLKHRPEHADAVAQSLRQRAPNTYPSSIVSVLLPPLSPDNMSSALTPLSAVVTSFVASIHEFGGQPCHTHSHGDIRVVTGDCHKPQASERGWDLLRDAMLPEIPVSSAAPSPAPPLVKRPPPLLQSPTTFQLFDTLAITFPPLPPSHTSCVSVSYDDSRFLPALLLSYLPSICDDILLLIGTTPWAGEVRTMAPTMIRIARAITELERRGYDAVSVHRGSWKNEAEQRNFGQKLARLNGATNVLVVDADEYYEVDEISNILQANEHSRVARYNGIMQREAQRAAQLFASSPGSVPASPTTIHANAIPPSLYATPFLFAPMLTYFGSINHVVSPPEKLMVLFLASTACDFSEARSLSCPGAGDITYSGAAGLDLQVAAVEGVYLSASDLVCHHFSYVRTNTELMNMKFASFHHSNEFNRDAWYAEVWLKWKAVGHGENLHPIVPHAYAATRRIGDWEKSTLGAEVDLLCSSAVATDVESDLWDLLCKDYGDAVSCAPPSAADAAHMDSVVGRLAGAHSPLSFVADPSQVSENEFAKVQIDGAAYSEQGSNEFSKHGSATQLFTTVHVNDLTPSDMIELDPWYSATSQYYDDCSNPSFVIVIMEEGQYDTSTYGIFSPIALSLQEAITSLWLPNESEDVIPPRVIISRCRDYRFCKLTDDTRYVIVLGAHHLVRYKDTDNNVASVISNFPPTGKTVIYNFEHAKSQVDFEVSDMWGLLKYYSPNVWEYGVDNFSASVQRLGEGSVSYVPLGYTRSLLYDANKRVRGGGGSDVIFYGRLNSYRNTVIESLREAGINVRHVNAVEDKFGQELEDVIMDSKIVLNLGYFGDREEWKMTRFVFPLANEVMVVSEVVGGKDEIEYWKDGIVFADDLIESVKYFMEHEEEREGRGRRGRELLMALDYGRIVRDPIVNLMVNGGKCEIKQP
jgi:hypothetical protein